jgi:ABC-type Mn2+/Zn2+ transport system permease subunit
MFGSSNFGRVKMLKQRIIAIFISLASAGILWETWAEARHGGSYFLKAAALAPVGIVAGIFLIFFPKYYGKPETAHEKIVIAAVYSIGVAFGLFNWYLIDPQILKF